MEYIFFSLSFLLLGALLGLLIGFLTGVAVIVNLVKSKGLDAITPKSAPGK